MKYRKVPKKEISEIINRLAATEDGMIVLALIKEHCGFDRNIMHPTDPVQTQSAAAIRGVYAMLRQYIKKEHLIDIEYGVEFVSDRSKRDGASD